MAGFLEQINTPEDLKKLSVPDLKVLAGEIRRLILDSVSRTGGHLASNLGMVELTIAMHYAFDFKKDKLLLDVGHQCYTHKILTARKDNFHNLRQPDGISGFPNPDESDYDLFAVGHAGTAIATAIGMALGQTHTKKDGKIIALVGDASIVNGLSFEALNNLGLVKRQLLIILNDNSMAIDPTQGAVAMYFSKLRLSHTYEEMVKTSKNILEHIPVIGKPVEEAIERLKKNIRMVLPPSQLFESLNIPYYGPVDGHDVASLTHLLKAISHLEQPAILHVHTEKGKGFTPAGEDPSRFHSTGPFKVNGKSVDSQPSAAGRSFTDVFADHIVELARKDRKIIAITSAMTDGTGLAKFRQEFPQRFYDVGIAESAAVDIAAGLAKSGLKPIVCIYSTFLQRSFDQIFQEVALQNLPVTFCIDRAGLVGADGPTHHGQMDIGFLRMMPNMVLVAPADDIETELALDFALNQNLPVCIRYPRDIAPTQDKDRAACAGPFEMGKSVTLKQSDDADIAVVAYGAVLTEALKAYYLLIAEGIEIDIINARFAAPVDERILSLPDNEKSIITVEDHRLACGFGSAVLEAAAAYSGALPARIINLAAPAQFIKHNCRPAQLAEIGVSSDRIVQTAKKMLSLQR